MARRRTETDSDLIAVCRLQGGDARVLMIEGNPGDRHLQDRFTCPLHELDPRLSAAGCSRVLAVLPSSATLVRTIHVPAGGELQVEAAIRLEAETRMLGSAPDHRTGLACLGIAGPHPTGLVAAWPEGLDPGLPTLSGDTETTWVPEIACLAFLAGEQPDSVHALLDPDGSTTAVVPTPNGPVFRSSQGGQATDLSSRLRPLIVESLLAEGLAPDTIEAESERLLLECVEHDADGELLIDPASEIRIQSVVPNCLPAPGGRDGSADRLLLAAMGVADGSMKGLAGLRETEFRDRPGMLGGLIDRLSDGRTAIAIAFAAVLVLILSPLASSGLRLMIMKGKVEDLGALEAQVRQVENLGKIYRELDKQAWSITKLLGDISNLMPEQIELVSISLAHGEPLSISGVAKQDGDLSGTDIIFMFNRALRESGLFADAGPLSSIDEPDARGYTEFKITAELNDPLRPLRLRPEEDYAVLTFQDRRYGPVDDDGYLIVDPDDRKARIDALVARGVNLDRELPSIKSSVDPNAGVSVPDEPRVADVAASDVTDAPATFRDRLRDFARTEGGSGSDERARGSSPVATRDRSSGLRSRGADPASRGAIRDKVIEVPEPLSSEEIDAMTVPEAKDRLGKVSRGRQVPGIDDETKIRLKSEFDLLMRRIREGDR